MSRFTQGQSVNTLGRIRDGYDPGIVVSVFDGRITEATYHVRFPDIGTYAHSERELIAITDEQRPMDSATAAVIGIEHGRILVELKEELKRLDGLQLRYVRKRFGQKDAYLEGRIDGMRRALDIVQRRGQ